MKQLPKKLREPSQDWFGKHRMTFHSAAVFYAQDNEEEQMKEEANQRLQLMRSEINGKRRYRKSVRLYVSSGGKVELKLFSSILS